MQKRKLSCGDMQVEVRPDLGASIERFVWRGIDIFRPVPADSSVREMGYFPLTPYSNRIGHGHLPGQGQLRLNVLPQPHSLHGFGWERTWQVVSHAPHALQMSLTHASNEDWPFDCEKRCEITLDDAALQVRLTLRNTDARSMPVGLGFHPFFPIDPATRLITQVSGMWQTENWLPVRHLALSEQDLAFTTGQQGVVDWTVDNCFTGWNGSAMLDYANHCVTISADPACGFLQCFQPGDGRPFISLEPISHVPNAHQLAEQGHTATGLRWLASGESFSVGMRIAPTAKSASTSWLQHSGF